MSTHLSTLLLLSARIRTQTLLTRQRRECQLISACTNSAHQTQADELTLNQQVPGSSPGRRTIGSGKQFKISISEQRTGLAISNVKSSSPSSFSPEHLGRGSPSSTS